MVIILVDLVFIRTGANDSDEDKTLNLAHNSPNDDGHPDNCDDDRFQNQLMWQMDSCKIVSIWNGLKISF